MKLRQLKTVSAGKAGKTPLANERGAVLIIVLVMLSLLIILGTSVLTSSTTEIQLAGNIRNLQQAFFTSQGALEIALLVNNNAVANAMFNVTDTWTGNIAFNAGAVVVTPGGTKAALAGTQNTAHIEAEFVASGTPPRGVGASADVFVANYYDVNVVGFGPNNSEVEIVSEVYKLQAKVD
jgi:Tfp pilus assembly protein PilX